MVALQRSKEKKSIKYMDGLVFFDRLFFTFEQYGLSGTFCQPRSMSLTKKIYECDT